MRNGAGRRNRGHRQSSWGVFSEIFFGGARGGGKADGVLGRWLARARKYGASFNAIMFRKTTVSGEDAIERSKAIFKPTPICDLLTARVSCQIGTCITRR